MGREIKLLEKKSVKWGRTCSAIELLCTVLITGRLSQQLQIYSQTLRLAGESCSVNKVYTPRARWELEGESI
jgi:hypothetical protein